MKNYIQFLNEIRMTSLEYFGENTFRFLIDFQDDGFSPNLDEKIDKIFYKLLKYFDVEECNRIRNYMTQKFKSNHLINFYWFFNFYETWGNSGTKRTTLQIEDYVTERSELPIFTLDEFLEMDLNEIKELVDAKEISKKYNL